MKVKFKETIWKRYVELQESDPEVVECINAFIEGIRDTEFYEGNKGRQQRKTDLNCYRINKEICLYYQVEDGDIIIESMKYRS